ncbi:hypothetical protein HDV00_008495 [Rhizophlyctis rosea]|nr:hypothetical protein HDV00_008495 [Rhizophlyctis rosea]
MAYAGTLEMVQYLLAKGISANSRGPYEKYTALDTTENIEILSFLLHSGADIEAGGTDGMSALMFALKFKYYEKAKWLIERGANVNAFNNVYNRRIMIDETPTPLSIAAKHFGNLDIVKMLVEKGAQVDSWALNAAVAWGSLANTQFLLSLVREKDINRRDRRGMTVIQHAASWRKILLLLRAGADPTVSPHLLHWAAGWKKDSNSRAPFDTPHQEECPLSPEEIRQAKQEAVGRMVEAGFDIDRLDPEGCTPLDKATKFRTEAGEPGEEWINILKGFGAHGSAEICEDTSPRGYEGN